MHIRLQMLKHPVLLLTAGLLLVGSFLAGCGPDTTMDTELPAEDLTEVEKETLESLQEDEASLLEETDDNEEWYAGEKAEFLDKIRTQRKDSIEQMRLIVAENDERDRYNPYQEDVLFDLADLYYELAKDVDLNLDYREEVALSLRPDPTAADPDVSTPNDPVVYYYKQAFKTYQDLANYYQIVESRNSRLAGDAVPEPTKYHDSAYYNMGVISQELADVDNFANNEAHNNTALENYHLLTDKFPDSEYAPECRLRLGRLYFEKGDFERGAEFFANIKPGEYKYDQSLYFTAWSYFLMTDYPRAVETFVELLDLGEQMSLESEEGARQAEMYYTECIDYVAICYIPAAIDPDTETEQTTFSEGIIDNQTWLSGPEPMKSFISGGLVGREYTPDIIRRSIASYVEYSWFPQAIELALFYTDTYPNAPEAPEVYYDIVEFYGSWIETLNYDRNNPGELAWGEQETARLHGLQNQARSNFVGLYDKGSSWYEYNKDNPVALASARAALARSLYDVGTYTYNLAMDAETSTEDIGDESRRLYLQVIEYFEKYLRDYPLEEDAYKANYYLSMAYFWGNEDYSSAGDNFLFTAKLYEGKNEHDEECLWNAAASYRFGSAEMEATRWEDKLNRPPEELSVEQQRNKVPSENPMTALPEVCQKFVYASREYGRTFREGNPDQGHNLNDMYHWEGNLMMAFDCYDSGREALERIVDLEYVPAYDADTDVMSRSRIAMKIADSWYDQHYYRKSAEWYRKAAALADVGCEMESTALANAASADFTSQLINEPIYELGEDEELPPEIREQLAISAEGYLQVGRDNLGQPEIALNAYKKAGSIYASQLMDYENAALVYHELAENFPDHPDVDEVLYSEALSYYKLEQWDRAAVVFESILTNSITGTPQEPRALFTAGECYENVKDWKNAARVFIRYGEDYRNGDSPDGVIDSYFRAGHAYIKLGDDITGREYLVKCTEEYEYFNAQAGIEVSYDNPAKAYMEIGNLLFEEYLEIEIAGDFSDLTNENSPLLVASQDKFAMMNELGEIYGRCAKAADLEINFGGRFMAGQVFENFYTSINGMDIRLDGIESLPADQQDMYMEALDTVMVQFNTWAQEYGRDMAVTVYENILKTASEHGEDNKWVDKARQRLVDLVPGRYMQYMPIGTREGVDRRGATIWELTGTRIYSEYINISGMAPVEPVYDDVPVDDTPTEFPLYDKFGSPLYDEAMNPLMNTGGWEAVYDSTGNPLLDAAGQAVFNDSNNTTDLFTEMGMPAYESTGGGGDSDSFPLYDKFGEALYDEAMNPLMNTGGWEAVYDKFGEPLLDAAGQPVFNDPNNSSDLFTEMGMPAYSGGSDSSYDDAVDDYEDTTVDPPLDDVADDTIDDIADDTVDDDTTDSSSGGTRQAYDRLGYPLFDSANNPLYDTAGGEEVYDEFGNPLLDDMGVPVTNVAGSPDLYDESGELLYP